MMQGRISPRRIDWYAVRIKPPRNHGRRTVVLDAEYETYRNRAKQARLRRVKGTGRREHLPKVLLERAGFEVFMPLRKDWRRVNRISSEKHLVTYPLLADWVFVGWDEGCPRWADLMELDIVVGMLGTNGKPALIPEDRIVQMMAQWGAGQIAPEHHRYMRSHAEFEVGDTVRVVDGSWAGFVMEVIEMDRSCAVGVIDLLGRETEVRMRANILEPVDVKPLQLDECC